MLSVDICSSVGTSARYEQLLQEAQEAQRKKEEFLSQQEDNFEDLQAQVVEEMEKLASQMEKKECVLLLYTCA